MKAWLRKLLCRIVGHNHVYGGEELDERTCTRCGRRQHSVRLYGDIRRSFGSDHVWITEDSK